MNRFLLFCAFVTATNINAISERWVYHDVTGKYMQNPAFLPGWQGASPTVSEGVGEVWCSAFNLYQVLPDMPAGEYVLTANAFYRCGNNDYAKANQEGNHELNTTYLYANDNQQVVKGLFEGHEVAPNSLAEANHAFADGQYLNTLIFTHKGGDITIGIANTGCYWDEWAAFDNFTLKSGDKDYTDLIKNANFEDGIDLDAECWNMINSLGQQKTPLQYSSWGGVCSKTNASPYNFGQQVELPAGKYRFSALTFHRYGGAGDYDGKIISCKGEWRLQEVPKSPKQWYEENAYKEDDFVNNAYLYVSYEADKPTSLSTSIEMLEEHMVVTRLKDSWEICEGNYADMPENEPRGTAEGTEIIPEYEVKNVVPEWCDSGMERESAAAFVANPELWRQYVEFTLEEAAKVWVGLGKDENSPAQYWNPFADFKLELLVNEDLPPVYTGDEFEYDGIWYTVVDTGEKTCKTKDSGNGVAGNLIIPAAASYENEEYSVIEIGQESFRGSESLLSVTLPASIQVIGTDAFANCQSLTSLVWTRHERLSRNVTDEIGNPNILLYVDSIRFAPEGMGANVVADGVCEYLDVTPGHAFTPLTPFTALQSRMVKEFTQKTYIDICAGWETIVLPFEANEVYAENIGSPLTPFAALTDMQAQRPFWLYEADEAGLWKEASGIRAGVPCIISMPNNPGYVSGYSIEGDVVFSSSEPQRITPETTAPYAVDWASGRQFRSLWLPLLREEAEDAMGLNVGMSWLTGDDGELLPPGSAFHAGVTPKPLEAYVTRIGSERAMKVMGGQSGVLPVIADGSLEIRVEDGALLLRSAANRKEFVFTPEGAILRMLELKAGETIAINDLIPGIYIVAGRKVILR